MNSAEFIDKIKLIVGQSSVDDLVSNLEKPPGRSPNKKLVELSDWYNSLDTANKERLQEIIKLAVGKSLFGILCVIDGVRQIESTSDKGELVLEFRKNGGTIRLNNTNQEYLHDLFNR